MRCSRPSLTNSTDTWFFTVFSETDSRSPICRLVRPSPISSRTLRSRADSPLSRVVTVRLVPQPGHRLARRARIQQRPAGGGHADRAGQIAAADLLEHVAGRSGHDRSSSDTAVAERRCGPGRRAGGPAGEPRGRREHRCTRRQPEIEHGDGGAQRRNLGQCGGCGAGLADHLDVRLGLQENADTATDEHLVLQDEDADRLSRRTAGRLSADRACHLTFADSPASWTGRYPCDLRQVTRTGIPAKVPCGAARTACVSGPSGLPGQGRSALPGCAASSGRSS